LGVVPYRYPNPCNLRALVMFGTEMSG